MRISILTIFPEMVRAPLEESILKRAREKGLLQIDVVNIRDFATDRHQSTDDYPYGGGPGMVMKPDPIYAALRAACSGEDPPDQAMPGREILVTSPAGEVFDQAMAQALAECSHLVIVCGHYEGVDDRVRELVQAREVSIGDYVLTGGELPSLVIADAVSRLVPGVLGGEGSAAEESFSEGLLEYPQYTRPFEFEGRKVPEVLLSGHHEEVRRWRRRQSLERTLERRPDLLDETRLTEEDRRFLAEIRQRKAQEELLAAEGDTPGGA